MEILRSVRTSNGDFAIAMINGQLEILVKDAWNNCWARPSYQLSHRIQEIVGMKIDFENDINYLKQRQKEL